MALGCSALDRAWNHQRRRVRPASRDETVSIRYRAPPKTLRHVPTAPVRGAPTERCFPGCRPHHAATRCRPSSRVGLRTGPPTRSAPATVTAGVGPPAAPDGRRDERPLTRLGPVRSAASAAAVAEGSGVRAGASSAQVPRPRLARPRSSRPPGWPLRRRSPAPLNHRAVNQLARRAGGRAQSGHGRPRGCPTTLAPARRTTRSGPGSPPAPLRR